MRGLRILLLAFLAVLARYTAASPDGAVIDVGSDKQLFIDELFFESTQGVKLVMNPPQKTGDRCIVADRSWERAKLGYVSTVMEDRGKFRLWYDAHSAVGLTPGPGRVTCYAESDDGVNWSKPVVGDHEFEGSRDNNIVLLTAPGTFFIDPNGPPEERYKYIGRNSPAAAADRVRNAGLWLFGSADGLRFRPLFGARATDIMSDTHDVAFWDPEIRKYVAYIKYIGRMGAEGVVNRPKLPVGTREGRAVWRMETNDLKRWPEPELVLAMDRGDRRDADFYNSAALRYPYAARAYFVFPSAYYHYTGRGTPQTIMIPIRNEADRQEVIARASRNSGPLDIQLAVSRDGIRYTRPDRRPFVRNGVEGSFDSRAMYLGAGFIRRGDELWLYYVGYDFTHGDLRPVLYEGKKGVISRLVLRLDGFVSADAGYDGGEIVSRPIRFTGSHLELNLDASAGGSVQVELLDSAGSPVPGFSLADADLLEGNSVRRRVTWSGKSNVSALSGRPVRIRWKMRDCKLYAFQFQ